MTSQIWKTIVLCVCVCYKSVFLKTVNNVVVVMSRLHKWASILFFWICQIQLHERIKDEDCNDISMHHLKMFI